MTVGTLRYLYERRHGVGGKRRLRCPRTRTTTPTAGPAVSAARSAAAAPAAPAAPVKGLKTLRLLSWCSSRRQHGRCNATPAIYKEIQPVVRTSQLRKSSPRTPSHYFPLVETSCVPRGHGRMRTRCRSVGSASEAIVVLKTSVRSAGSRSASWCESRSARRGTPVTRGPERDYSVLRKAINAPRSSSDKSSPNWWPLTAYVRAPNGFQPVGT